MEVEKECSNSKKNSKSGTSTAPKSVDSQENTQQYLAASIFYNKHEIVLDDKKGTIDKTKS